MDYKKMTKSELLDEIELLNAQLHNAQVDYKELMKVKDGLIKSDYDLRKQMKNTDKETVEQLEQLNAKVEELTKENGSLLANVDMDYKELVDDLQNQLETYKVETRKTISDLKDEIKFIRTEREALSTNFNSLAALFDDYIKAFDDQHILYKVMVRNSENTISLLKGKIEKFNSKGE
jgi:chromosome segregation ATPase